MHTKSRLCGGFLLLLHFLVDDSLAKGRVVLLDLDLALDLLLILTSPIHVVGLRRTELNKAIL